MRGVVKVDLDVLERNARDMERHASCCGRRYMEISPPVTLALVRRIRELEAFAATLIHDHVRNTDETEMHALLEKGAVTT